eukprot:2549983-Rhodomonas_salina.2
MASLNFVSMLRALSSVRMRSRNWFLFRKKTTPSGFKESERKGFTDLESIKVDALYNSHQIKTRKSFVVSADCIVQDGDIAGKVAQNDPSSKIGCVLKPAQSMREVMTPSHNTQTWHKKASSASFSVSSSTTSKSKKLQWSRKNSTVSSAVSSASTIPSGNGVRNAFALEQSLEALEQVQEEMKDLKDVIEDAERFHDQPQLQRAIANLAAKKQATLRNKLNDIYFEGEDVQVFDKLKAKLSNSLDRLTKDWSLGGLALSQAPTLCPSSRDSSRTPSRISSMAPSRMSSLTPSRSVSRAQSRAQSAFSSNNSSRVSSRRPSASCCQSVPRSSRAPSVSDNSMRTVPLLATPLQASEDLENRIMTPHAVQSEPSKRNRPRVFVGTLNTQPSTTRRCIKVNLAAAMDREKVDKENIKVDV